MFKINASLKDSDKINSYLQELEFRSTAYLRKFAITVADNYSKQIGGRYQTVKDEQAGLIRDNLETFFVNYKVVPKKDKGDQRKETKEFEEHYTAVMVHAVKRSARDIDANTHVVKVLQNKRALKQTPPEVFLLVRYGPWHMDYLPFVPKDQDATITFVEAPKDKVLSIKEKNKKNRFKVKKLLRQYDVKPMSRDDVYDQLNGYDSLEYWAMRKEFGLDGRKVAIWKPALVYITNEGYKKIIQKDLDLHRILFDPNFKNYKNVDKGYKIIGEDQLNPLIDFQDRLRG